MKISKLALVALLGSALMAFGCSDDTSTPGGTGGTAGGGGTTGTGGTAGGGGTGGTAGTGGGGGTGPVACAEVPASCTNGAVDPTDENCSPALATPPTADVCTGTESLDNPASCTATGTVVTHQLTQLQIFEDCNVGYDLDSCSGRSCLNGGLAPGEGIDGVDNALAGLAPTLVTVGGNLGGVNQAFYDGVCAGGIDLGFAVDANAAENCATVDLLVDGVAAGTVLLNVSEPTDGAVCASGTIGAIPLNIGDLTGAIGNSVLRVTISEGGFSNGTLGGTVDQATAVGIAELLLEGAGAIVAQVLDINDDLSGDAAVSCNALSLTLTIGGVVEAPAL